MIKIKLANIYVDDQAKALSLYTDVLGFVKRTHMAVGDYRWLTVVSPAERNGTELVFETSASELARAYQKGLFEGGMPAAIFEVSDINAEYERLKAHGVTFRTEPTAMGPVTIAALEDTCGNVIQLAQG